MIDEVGRRSGQTRGWVKIGKKEWDAVVGSKVPALTIEDGRKVET